MLKVCPGDGIKAGMFEKSHFDRELAKLERHADAGYFVALHIRFTSPLMTFRTYDQAWTDHYTNNGYASATR
jgi:LuxR family transcriptional regulator